MPNANLLKNRLRDSTGLVVTIAVHAGVAAIALLAVTVVVPAPPPAPIITRPIPDPVPPRPVPAKMPITDLPIRVDPVVPDYIVETPPTAPDPIVVSTPTIGPPTADAPSTPADPPALPLGITRIARLDPRFGDRAQPPYPTAARRAGEEGNVLVHVRIGRDGRVIEASLARSSGSPRLDAAAVAHALANWRFTPALDNGVAVEAARDITVTFRLAAA